MKITDIIVEASCAHGQYYCSTDKKWKCRQGPKQTRATEAANPAQQAAIAIAKKKKQDVAEGLSDTQKKIEDTILKLEQRLKFAKTPEQWDNIKNRIERLQAGLNRSKQGVAEGYDDEEHPIRDDGNEGRPGKQYQCPRCHSTDIKTYSDGEKECHQCHKTWDVKGVAEEKQRLDPKCWDGYKKQGTKIKGGVRVNNCVKEELEETYDGDEFFEAYGELWFNEDEQLDEAEYQGRKVQLGKPMRGDVKKFKVYVKDPSTGNIKKVNFGDPDMKIRKSNPAARRSFRARHNCDNPGPRTKARYWSCRKW